ncbi:MAG: redoxin domain-containing protein [bacterium]|nr:redoxin domain-containing protein [bacterium]
MMVVQINSQEEFKTEVLDFDGIVILDCWAEWCAPCRMLVPVLEEVAAEYADDNVKVVKVNVESSRDNMVIAQQLGVSSIPALFYFKK